MRGKQKGTYSMFFAANSACCLVHGNAAQALGRANGGAFGPFNHGQAGTAHGWLFVGALWSRSRNVFAQDDVSLSVAL